MSRQHAMRGGQDKENSSNSMADFDQHLTEDSEKTAVAGAGAGAEQKDNVTEEGKIILQQEDCYDKLGYSYPTWKKWSVLTVIFLVQCSMNFNASVYANVVNFLTVDFHISAQGARVGQCVFLIAYAFGSEFWAPWSEELGRWPVMQLSLFLVNIWQIPCALAPNYGTIVICRILGGLSSAGGSVTLGMVADMWEPDDQQYAVAYVVLSSVGGSIIGPIVGAFSEAYLGWQWIFWLQLIFGVAVQAIHFCIPETRSSILIDREAKRRRKAGEANIWGPGEATEEHKLTPRKVLTIWARPFIMFVKEPIVLCLSLLSGFSDALIFTFLESFQPVYTQWGFKTVQQGLAFIPIAIGYLIAYLSFFPFIRRHVAIRRRDPDALQPEARLYWLLYMAPLETIGLFGFAWTSLGPAHGIPWIAPMLFSMLVGAANYAIYMATIDYMVAAYGPYSASATGGNALARDFLAGVAALYATPFYTNLPSPYTLEYPTTILACLAFLVTIPIYVFYWKGPAIRERSQFAQTLASDRKAAGGEGRGRGRNVGAGGGDAAGSGDPAQAEKQ